MFRQTNIVWVFWLACQRLLDLFEDSNPVAVMFIIRDCLGYGLVGMLFVAFVQINGGIVLGDRASHEPVFHFSQLLLLINTIALLSYRLLKNYEVHVMSRVILFVAQMPIYSFTTVFHPYHRGENSHLTSKAMVLYSEHRSLVSAGMSFIGCWSIPVVIGTSLSSMGWVRSFLFWTCAAVTTVPSPLVEPRYFIVPTVLFILQMDCYEEAVLNIVKIFVALDMVLLRLMKRTRTRSPMIW